MRKKIENIELGAEVEFSIEKASTIRNVVSLLNSIYYLKSKRWKSETVREKGIIIVKRVL